MTEAAADAAAVDALIAGVRSPTRRRDAETMLSARGPQVAPGLAALVSSLPRPLELELYARVTGHEPYLEYKTIIGYGHYHYRYESGREGDAGAAGFSPRAAATTVYLPDGFDDYTDQLAALGPHTTGKCCLYLKDLTKIELGVLEEILTLSWKRCSAPGFGQV